MCFVWISEQTAIIFLYNINWLVFTTERECVYCAVRDEFVYVVHLTSRLSMLHMLALRYQNIPETRQLRLREKIKTK